MNMLGGIWRALLGTAWTVMEWFRRSEPGFWYEAVDPANQGATITMYQDSTGVTPVTAPEQAVGLVLDRSRGLVRGVEKTTNGGFDADTGWTKGAGWSIAGGLAVFSGSGGNAISQDAALVANKSYEILISIASVASGGLAVRAGLASQSPTFSSPGQYRTILPRGTNGFVYIVSVGATDAAVASISVRELPGNHASQSVSASRPVISQRYNLLLASAAMATQSVTVAAASHTLSFTGTGTVTLSGTSTAGPLVGTGANDRVSLTFTPTAGALTLTVTGSVTLADLRLTIDTTKGMPAYQRVNTATDYDTAGFLPYFKFDGFDDSWQTAAIDFTSTDKVTVIAGVTKLSDAAVGTLIETSANWTTVNGAIAIFAAPVAAAYGGRSRGTAGASCTTAGAYAAPKSDVLTLIGDIAADVCTLRVSGASAATDAADQGTGNYGNHALNIGRRNNTSLPFNGRLSVLIGRGAASNDSQIAKAERYTNRRTGASF